MNAIRAMADLILDTSNLTVHELRDVFMRMSRDEGGRAEMVVNLVSFGYKHGVPVDADLVFDVRCLPNPHFVDGLRPLTGRDAAVVRYMRRHAATREFIERLTSFLRFALPQYVQEGKSYLTVAIGCTGGRHRSVMMAEALKKSLADVKGVRLRVKHRDSLTACEPMIGVVVVTHGQLATELRERGGDDRRRPAAVRGGVDRLARGHAGRARRDRAGDRPRASRGRAC